MHSEEVVHAVLEQLRDVMENDVRPRAQALIAHGSDVEETDLAVRELARVTDELAHSVKVLAGVVQHINKRSDD